MQAAARGRKTECAEETPNLSHLPGATMGLPANRRFSHEVQSLQLQAGLQARARQGANRKLAYWLFCFPPPPPPEIRLSGLKRLDLHFPNVVWAASRACSGCRGCSRYLFLEFPGGFEIRGEPSVSLILIVRQVILYYCEECKIYMTFKDM